MAFSHYTMHCKLTRPFGYCAMKVVRTCGHQKCNELSNIETNPYYEKYAKKIAALQQTSPEKFLNNANEMEKIELCRKNLEQKFRTKTNKVNSISVHPQKAQPNQHPVHTQQKTLDNIMKTELLKEKSQDEISKIWQEYHQMKKGIAAVIPAALFQKISSNAKEYPTFLYPIPRKEGYEFILGQFSGYECHFTPLINFQAYKEEAPTCLSIMHYPDLQQEKGIVLMHGEFDDRVLTVQEAQCLANQIQLYYGGKSTRKLSLLRTFNKSPQSFKHVDLIKEFESIVIQ